MNDQEPAIRLPAIDDDLMREVFILHAKIANEAAIEAFEASRKHRRMNSFHEAYGVIAEEFAEFFDEVRKKHHNKRAIREELLQVAAMCLRTVHDLIDERSHD